MIRGRSGFFWAVLPVIRVVPQERVYLAEGLSGEVGGDSGERNSQGPD